MMIYEIKDCTNSLYQLKKWRQTFCVVHKCNSGTGSCECPPPLELISFPTDKKDPALMAKWIKLVNRQLKPGRNWTPDNDSRICFKHFETINPVWTLQLGYGLTTTVKLRQLPTERQPLTHKKKTRKKNASTNIRVDENENVTHQATLSLFREIKNNTKPHVWFTDIAKKAENRVIYEGRNGIHKKYTGFATNSSKNWQKSENEHWPSKQIHPFELIQVSRT